MPALRRIYRPDFAKLELTRVPPEPYHEPESSDAPFKAGGKVVFQLLITNTSDKRVYFPVEAPYTLDRLRLYGDGKLIPHREDVVKLVQEQDDYRGRNSGRFTRIEPRGQLTAYLHLDDRYEPLRAGNYKLVAERRFIVGGGRVESPPVEFRVVP